MLDNLMFVLNCSIGCAFPYFFHTFHFVFRIIVKPFFYLLFLKRRIIFNLKEEFYFIFNKEITLVIFRFTKPPSNE